LKFVKTLYKKYQTIPIWYRAVLIAFVIKFTIAAIQEGKAGWDLGYFIFAAVIIFILYNVKFVSDRFFDNLIKEGQSDRRRNRS